METTQAASHASDRGPGNPRELFGWLVYDWANSAFSTTVAGTLAGIYLTQLAQEAVGENGVVIDFGALGVWTAKSFFPKCIAVSVFLQIFLLPVLGSIADYSALKKRIMAVFCYIGVAATCALPLLSSSMYVWTGLLFIVANLSFGASIVLYNAFLPEICPAGQHDKVSSRGFALGYLGGGLLLALNFLLLQEARSRGLTSEAIRLSLLSAGIWWGAFAAFTFARLQSRPARRPLPAGRTAITAGFSDLSGAFGQLRRLPHTLRYLIGYLLYNDGIQTVIGMAGVFLSQELFTAEQRAAGEDKIFVLAVFLMTQFVAFPGAILFEKIAGVIGTKGAILASLVVWSGIVVYAYGFLHTTSQAWGMAAAIAIVLGGSQALSRSLFARMIPTGYEASFFGLYEVSERGTSWIGPYLFGEVVQRTGSYRLAILSLIVLFVAGTATLAVTNTDRAIRDAHTA